MKRLSKLIFITVLFMVGLISVEAKPFRIGDVEYDTLKEAVAAAPTDNTVAIIEMTEDVTLAPGVQIVAGQNLVIDFGGHTYETWEPMVGSAGTQTQSFQILKGSTVYMKNGTLVASTHERSRMFIQNYADLTVDNISIDATTNTYEDFYAISSNYGEVVLKGNTNISVNRTTRARAFDMCWAPVVGSAAYAGGTQITVDTTGTISGLIELDVWGTWADDPRSTLVIKNGNFNVTWDIDERLAGQLSIQGGKFNSSVDEYTANGYSEYTTDNETFDVLPSGTISLKSNAIYVAKGKTASVEVEVEDTYKKYVKYEVLDAGVATLSNGVLTGVSNGSTTLEVSLGKLGDSASVTVYEVKPAETEDPTEEEVNEEATTVTTQIVEAALTEDEVEGLDEETIENVKDAVLAGKTVETEVELKEVKKEDVPEEVISSVEEEVKKESGKIVGYLDINLLLKAEDEELGKVTKLPTPIKVVVEVDDELGNVPANATRKYFVVRVHNGETTLLEATYKDGKLEFETDRFSQYMYGYSDTVSNIPQTGDNITLYVTLFVISTLGIVGTFMLSRKKLFSVSK